MRQHAKGYREKAHQTRSDKNDLRDVEDRLEGARVVVHRGEDVHRAR